jgi:uncharacterized membrane protein HdeD (DUF308 family)
MALDTQTLGPDPIVEEMRQIGHRSGHFMVLGIILIVLGTLAILDQYLATFAIVTALGILLAVGGVVEIVGSFWAAQWRGFFLELLLGILYLVAGVLMIRHPVVAAMGFTFILAFALLAGGFMRIAFAITHRTVGTGWVLFNGIISVILGLMIWWQWPWDSLQIIGLFVGIDMIFLGWSWVMLGAAVRPGRTQPT